MHGGFIYKFTIYFNYRLNKLQITKMEFFLGISYNPGEIINI